MSTMHPDDLRALVERIERLSATDLGVVEIIVARLEDIAELAELDEDDIEKLEQEW